MKRFFKILMWVAISLLSLVIGLVIFVQTPYGQRVLKNYAVDFLEKKLGTPVVIDRIGFTIPTNIVLEGVLFVDKNNDTLLSLEHLNVNVAMLELLNSKLKVDALDIEGFSAYMHRPAGDSTFNYEYIINAFSDTSDVSVDAVEEFGEVEEGKAQSMLFDVSKVRLKDIKFVMNDQAGGTYFDVILDSLLLTPKVIDPGNMKYLVDELHIYKAASTLKTFPGTLPPEEDTSTSSTPLILSARKLTIVDSRYDMLTEPDSFYLYAGIGSFDAGLELFDLEQSLIDINEVLLTNASNHIVFGKPTGPLEPEVIEQPADPSDTSKWRIRSKKMVVNNTEFKLDDNLTPRQREGLDYSHMHFYNLSMIVDNINFLTDTIQADLAHLSGLEQCGLEIIEMKSEIFYSQQGVDLNNFVLQTPHTLIQDKLSVRYPSIESLSTQPEKMFLDMRFVSSYVSMNDIYLVSPPSLWPTISPYRHQRLSLDGGIEGYLSQLNINNLTIDGLDRTRLHLSGTLTGLPDMDKFRYQFNTLDIKTSKKDILPFIPASMLESFNLPDHIDIAGTLHGSIYDYYPDLTINTSDGALAVKGAVNIQSQPEKYNLVLATKALNVGKIIKNDSLVGLVSLNGTLVGSSFDVKTMNAHLNAHVDVLDFNQYRYSNVLLDGKIQRQFIDLKLNSRDLNADMDIIAGVDISKEFPEVQSSISLRRVDLKALNFYEDSLELAGDIELDFSRLDPDYPVGFVKWHQPMFKFQGEDIAIDSLYISSQPNVDSGQNILAVIPNFIDARLSGQIPLTKIGTATLQHINNYFTFDPKLEKYNERYNVDLSMVVQHHPILKKFVPELTTLSPVDLKLQMDDKNFDFNLVSDNIVYGSHSIEELNARINDSNSALFYNVRLDEYTQDDTVLVINKPTLFGNIKNNLLDGNFKTFDRADAENYALGFQATYNNNRYILSLKPQLKLNYDPWTVNSKNWVAYHLDSGLVVNQLGITKGNESIFIQSEDVSTYNTPFDIKINQFQLANVSRILNPNSLLAEGILNADINADISDTFPKIVGDLKVDSLKFYETEVGLLQARVHNNNVNIFDVNASITQFDNNILLSGGYYMQPINGNDFYFDLDLKSLSLKQFEGLSFGHLRDSKGFIKGIMNLSGTVDQPKINGHIETDDLATRIAMLNSYWSFPKERIEFNNQTIAFKDFKIYDSLGQHATIAGQATTKNFTDFDLNLNFSSNRWMATNSTGRDLEWMYGRLILTSQIDISGTSSSPILNGNVVVHDSTNFTYANIDSGPGITDHEGYVVFVKDINDISSILNDTTARAKSTAMSMNLNIETEKEATFNVLVNALSGDILTVNGAAFINASMIPGGKFLLTGSYQIEDGFYELNYNFIKRKFKIQEGSSIQLTGDPMDADVNITAAYTADASAYDLMEKNVSQEELVFYKQRMPFDVLLKITGKPLSPIIKYDIVLSENNAKQVDQNVADNIQRQLAALRNDVSEMSKQVFGMLILGRFIADDPIKSGNPVSMEYYARQTASRFLSQQLNSLADKYVSGLDLSLDLESQEDYSTGQRENRTDINLQASKSLFNDRLTVTIGNDFQIEGRQLPGQQNNLIPGNISLDYKLTKDGKYNVRGYRKNELLNVIDGYVVETGVGFMLKYDYNRFRELFYSREKLREIYRKRREEELKKEQEKNNEIQNNSAKK